MRAWISSEENQETLLRIQKGFPELFTNRQDPGKTGPFPISHLRDLMNLYAQREQHSSECYVDPKDTCTTCDSYENLPDFPIPRITFQAENIPDELLTQIESRLGNTIHLETYFPYKLYEISHKGNVYYLGDIDLLNISLFEKSAVYIDT